MKSRCTCLYVTNENDPTGRRVRLPNAKCPVRHPPASKPPTSSESAVVDDLDKDLQYLTRPQLKQVAADLRKAIRTHRDAHLHDRCWLNDQELYTVLPETAVETGELPPREEFLGECALYWERRQPAKRTT